MQVRNTTFVRDAMRTRIKAALQETVRRVSAEAEAASRFKRLHCFSSEAVIVDDIDEWQPLRVTAIDVDADRIIIGEIIEP